VNSEGITVLIAFHQRIAGCLPENLREVFWGVFQGREKREIVVFELRYACGKNLQGDVVRMEEGAETKEVGGGEAAAFGLLELFQGEGEGNGSNSRKQLNILISHSFLSELFVKKMSIKTVP
jgi:hypothetical protein